MGFHRIIIRKQCTRNGIEGDYPVDDLQRLDPFERPPKEIACGTGAKVVWCRQFKYPETQSSPPRVLSKEQPGTPAGPSSFSRDFTMRKIGRAHCPAHRLCLVKKRQEKREDAGRKAVGTEDVV
jgi:hypothetical protein